MIRSMLGVAIAAAVLSGCASKTQNNTQTLPALANDTRSATTAPSAAAAAGTARPASGSLLFPASTAAATAAAPEASPEAASTAAPEAPAVPGPSSSSSPATAPTASAPAPAPPAAAAATQQAAPPAAQQPPQPAASANAGAAATPAAPRIAQVPAVDASDLIDSVKLSTGDLPSGYGLGGLQGYQTNEMAVNGFEDPAAVRDLMTRTGRASGYIQQITTPESSNGAGVSVEVWQDAAGAKSFFDQFPRPAAGLDYQQIDVPGLGEQVFAYRYQINGQTGYSLAWRRGRVIMGVGELVGNAADGLERVLAVARLIDKKAQAAPQ